MRVLGIHCRPDTAYVALVEGATVVPGHPERLRLPTGIETGDGLLECIAESRRLLGQTQPDQIALLLPEPNAATSAKRTVFETLIRVAAAEEGTPVNLVARMTVRSRLKLPRSGKLEDHVMAAGCASTGRYWRDGRGLAALAALTVTS